MSERKYIDLKQTAIIMRQALKAAFPDVKFSVRCEFYSCGSHINVKYTDGPPSKAVSAITDQFYGTGFDGMTDSTTHHNGMLNGEVVRFAGSRPSIVHDQTHHGEVMATIRKELAAQGRFDKPFNDRAEWMILGNMDFRWETPQRAVAKFFANGCKLY